jgi:two-component system sensor histidine kinase BaeS
VLEGASPGATGAQVARQLQELTELRQRLVADLVHDVRAPLLNLAARGQRLASGLDDELRQEGLEIRAAALSTLEQIEELVDLSALQHRRTTLHPADCDLVRTLQTVARGFEAVAARSGVDLVVETPDRLQIRADEHKLTIILGNLVANAVQYAGDQTTVCLAARVEDGELVLEVRDDGTGIAPENLEVVFDRFWRRDFGRRQDGRGLGLTIAREMTELHGGTIEAGVAPEGGARFTARIPYVAPAGASTMPSLQEAAARHLSTEVAVAELQRRLGPDRKPGSRRRRDTRRRA